MFDETVLRFFRFCSSLSNDVKVMRKKMHHRTGQATVFPLRVKGYLFFVV
jgi:hypothetical protein